MSNHPNYHKGFYDAQSGQPLFDDADPIYAEGWRGYWIVREGVKKLQSSQILYHPNARRLVMKIAIAMSLGFLTVPFVIAAIVCVAWVLTDCEKWIRSFDLPSGYYGIGFGVFFGVAILAVCALAFFES